MAVDYKDTAELILTVESMKEPASFLVDTFFPNHLPVSLSKTVEIEYRSRGRVLAPYVSEGGSGVNIVRSGTQIASFRPPMVAPKRIISIEDVEMRDFGEQRVASKSARERWSAIQARDLDDLMCAIKNRKNQMASEILTTGKVTCKGYADDMQITELTRIDFEWQGLKEPSVNWNQANADPYGDLEKMSEFIREREGTIPTVAILGKTAAKYLTDNKKIKEWLAIPSRENFALMSLQPRLISPQIMRIGMIQSLNLELYTYAETYKDENGETQQYFPENGVLVAIPGFGSQIHGAINAFDRDGNLMSYANELVPVYQVSPEGQSMSLTLRSRFILVPTQRDAYCYMNVAEGAQLPGI